MDVATSETAEDAMVAAERAALLSALLDRLEPHRRAAVVAYELDGLAMVEVAAAQRIPLNTAWNRLRLGREDLRAAARKVTNAGH